jgi:hypothetical protein
MEIKEWSMSARCILLEQDSVCSMTGAWEKGNQPTASTKGGEFLDQLSDCQLLNKNCVPWSKLINYDSNNNKITATMLLW